MVITILELEGGNHCRPSPSPERDFHHCHSIGGHVAAEKEREGHRGKFFSSMISIHDPSRDALPDKIIS